MQIDFGRTLAEYAVRHRLAIISLTVLFCLWAASGIGRLSFSNDSRIYFSSDNPQLKALEELENTFNKEDNLLFVIAPQNGNVFTRETLAAIEELTRECWQIPFSSRVNSITNFQHTEAREDELVVADLVHDSRSLSDEDLASIRRTALAEPLLVNRLISPEGKVTAVSVLITKPGNNIDETSKVAAYGRGLAGKFRAKHPDLKLYLTGGIMIDNAFGEASRDDMQTLVPAMYAVLLLVLALALKSFYGTLAVLLVIVSSMVVAIGLTGWLGLTMSPSTVNAPTIILTLAVADSVHLLTTAFHLMNRKMGKKEALIESLHRNLGAVTITSLTTAIGFLSMNFSDAPPFRDLGNIVAMGVLAAWLLSILFLPAFASLLPLRVKIREEKDSRPFCDWVAGFVIRRRGILLVVSLLATGVSSLGMMRIELNDDFVKYFDNRYEFRRATDFAEQHLLGFNVIQYTLSSGEAGGINDPAYLDALERFSQWYRRQPKVAHVQSYADTIKRLNKNMHGDDESYFLIPDDRRLAAQYLLLYEMSLPFGHDLNNMINIDKSSTRMIVSLRNISSRELREMDSRARQWLRENAPPSMFSYGTGLSIMFAHISERNIKSMLGASFGALFLISLVLIVALRSFKIGFLSLLPNLTPAFTAFGLWGYFVGQVGLVISILAALTLGIVVDDTVHFLYKYLHARRRQGMDPENAVRYAFHTVGTALWMTTVVLAAGFLVLAFSGFEINADMGLMTAITIMIALGMDFFFLPSLLLLVDRK
jgi:predicted RND superfamily exporter protein